MPLVSTCPKCDASVLVPDGFDASAKSKCPLCEEQFELSEVLSSLPPMLEMIDQPASVVVGTDGGSTTGDIGSGVLGGLLADMSSDEAWNGAATDAEGDILTVEDEAESEEGGFGGIDFSEASDAGGVALDTADEAPAPASMATKSRPKRRKGPGPIFQVAGIVIFGILGIGIACLILLWIKGPQGDILGIGKYLPNWLYSANDTSAEGSDPNVDVNESSKSKKKSKKNRSDDDKGGNGDKSGSDLPSLNFDFDNPKKNLDKDGNPKEREVGPLKLEQTLRHNIDQAVDEVRVAAAKFAAEDEKVKNGKEAGDDLKFADRDHYFALANLGKVISSAKAGSLNKELTDRIRLFVHNAVGDHAKFDAAGDKATKWIKYQKRKERDGILLAGTVESLRLTPNIFEAGFTIAGTDEKITIVSDQKAPSPGQKLLALGVIVTDPKENLTGYKGDKEEVVWVGLAFKALKPGAPPVELPIDKPEKPEPKKPDPKKPGPKKPEKPDPKKPPVDDKKPVIDEPEIDEPPIELPKIDDPIDEPKIEEPAIEEPKIDEPKIDEPAIEEPAIEEPEIEEPAIEEPAVEEPAKEDE